MDEKYIKKLEDENKLLQENFDILEKQVTFYYAENEKLKGDIKRFQSIIQASSKKASKYSRPDLPSRTLWEDIKRVGNKLFGAKND